MTTHQRQQPHTQFKKKRRQGDIEKVASRSPEGLAQLFEQIAGSDALKRPYEQLADAKVRARGCV